MAVSFYVLRHWLGQDRLSDVGVYQHYSDLMRAGQVPYRDFAVEYPPAALPAFVLPAYLPWSYTTSFALAMAICGVGCLVAASAALRAVRAGVWRSTGALLLIGVSPLALGSLFDTRFDLWPVLLALTALVFVLRENSLAAGALSGFAFAAKLWPVALAPLGLAYLWRRRGRRAAAAGAAAFVVAAAVCFIPFAILSPGGIRHSFTTQLDRPLQVESLGAAVLMGAERLGAPSYPTVGSHGGQALSGSVPDAVAAASSAAEILAVVAIWIVFARRRRPTGEALLVASAATIATFLAFGKVFSPQFMIWLVPFVPLVRGLRGLGASGLLVAALMLTQTWFPDSYWTLALDHASPWCWYLLGRDLSVIALAVFLAWPEELQDERLGEHRSRLEALEAIRAHVE